MQSSTSAAAAPATPSPAGASVPPTAGGETPATFYDPSALTIGAQRAEAIANLEAMGMGFERPQIEAAMRAAFFNPDRAVEYLLNVGVSGNPILQSTDKITGHPRESPTRTKNATCCTCCACCDLASPSTRWW